MSLMRFKAGTEIKIEGRPMRFVEFIRQDGLPGVWHLRRLDAEGSAMYTTAQLARLFDKGDLVRLYTDGDALTAGRSVPRAPRIHALDDLSEGDQMRRATRAEFIRRVQAQIGLSGAHKTIARDKSGAPTTIILRALQDVSEQMQDKLEHLGLHNRMARRNVPAEAKKGTEHRLKSAASNSAVRVVAMATYYRWTKLAPDPEDRRGLEGAIALRGNRHQILPEVRSAIQSVMLSEIEKAKDRSRVGKLATVTIAGMRDTIDTRLADLKISHPHLASKITLPSATTINREWSKFSAFDRTVAKYGPGRARRDFRFVKGHEHPEAPYELIEYDETRLPFFFVDDVHNIVLGKGNLCVGMCVATHSVGGFHLSFEPFSDLTLMNTLRHVVSLKSYVRDEYGDRIKGDYLPGGMMRCVGVDNSRQAWGKSFQEICRQIQCERVWLPPRTPWFKPIVEGFFGMLNRMLLRELPGFDVGREVDRRDYDPALNACISIRQFTFLLHAWIIDRYHQQKQPGLGNRSPNERWNDLLVNGEPGLLDSSDDLDSLFSIVREGTLDHRGVRFMNIRYGGEELEGLRLILGKSSPIRVKINPSNLLQIRVWHPRLQIWLRGQAYRQSYANGLSLHVHKLVQAQNKRQGRMDVEDTFIISLAELQQLVADSMPEIAKSGAASKLARAVGIGSHHLLSDIDHTGQLGSPTGPWLGKTVSPFNENAAAASAEQESAKTKPDVDSTTNVEQTSAASSRRRKTFTADDSILHIKLNK